MKSESESNRERLERKSLMVSRKGKFLKRKQSLSILISELSKLRYDRVSDVVENGVRFASKILTHNRMH